MTLHITTIPITMLASTHLSLLSHPDDPNDPAYHDDPHHETNLFAHLSLLSDPDDSNDPAYHEDPITVLASPLSHPDDPNDPAYHDDLHHDASLYSSLAA